MSDVITKYGAETVARRFLGLINRCRENIIKRRIRYVLGSISFKNIPARSRNVSSIIPIQTD